MSEKQRLATFVETKTDRLEDLYICAGDRTYVVGSQDGMFPDFGHHVENEMGGIWTHPIKLLDGYWLKLSENGADAWLTKADRFTNYPFYNEHLYQTDKLQVIRRQYCPDGLQGVVVTYHLKNIDKQEVAVQPSFLVRTDLSPVWFSERAGIEDGQDSGEWNEEDATFVGRDEVHPWFVKVGSNLPVMNHRIGSFFGPEQNAGQGVSGELQLETLTLATGETAELHFFIAGSYQSLDELNETYRTIAINYEQLFAEKQARYESIVQQTEIQIPDASLQNVFNWVKFNNDWLVRDVPEIGRGITAGHPEYPWWFGCDSSYAVLGLLPLGEFSLAESTLKLIQEVSTKENGKNGRIIHEVSTFGVVSNQGNTQETPHFIKAVWDTFLWTGNIEFLKEMYPTVKAGIAWLVGEMDEDGDLLPEGYGIIEIAGLNVELLDTAVYTHEALKVGAQMANLMGEREIAHHYQVLRERLARKINEELWIETEGLYADVVATPKKLLERFDLYIDRAREYEAWPAVAELEAMKVQMLEYEQELERPWLFKNWIINTPMEVGLAPREKAIRALERMSTEEFTGPWGTYLSGMFQKHMMTISTGVQAVAEAKYGRIDEALRYVKLIESTFNHVTPGSISEMSPDYGCFVQAWTNYGIVWPVMVHMFGIQPVAHEKRVTIRPHLPSGWNEAAVQHVKLGEDGDLSISIVKGEESTVYEIKLSGNNWTVIFEPLEENVVVNGEKMDGKCIELFGSTQYYIVAK